MIESRILPDKEPAPRSHPKVAILDLTTDVRIFSSDEEFLEKEDSSWKAGEEFDLVLTDLHIEGRLDGIDVARAVHEHDPAVPVLLETASWDDPAVGGRAAKSGMRAIIHKPFDIAELKEQCVQAWGYRKRAKAV